MDLSKEKKRDVEIQDRIKNYFVRATPNSLRMYFEVPDCTSLEVQDSVSQIGKVYSVSPVMSSDKVVREVIYKVFVRNRECILEVDHSYGESKNQKFIEMKIPEGLILQEDGPEKVSEARRIIDEMANWYLELKDPA